MHQESFDKILNRVVAEEGLYDLQLRLEAAGVDYNLENCGEERAPEVFREQWSDLLRTPMGKCNDRVAFALTDKPHELAEKLFIPEGEFRYLATNSFSLGQTVEFFIKEGQSLRNPLDFAIDFYEKNALPGQKHLAEKVVGDERLMQDPLLDRVVEQDSRYFIRIFEEAQNQTRQEVIDDETGEILIEMPGLKQEVEQSGRMKAAECAVLTVAAALRMAYAVKRGILMGPANMSSSPKGENLFSRQRVRTRSDALSLNHRGLLRSDIRDSYRGKDVIAAGLYLITGEHARKQVK